MPWGTWAQACNLKRESCNGRSSESVCFSSVSCDFAVNMWLAFVRRRVQVDDEQGMPQAGNGAGNTCRCVKHRDSTRSNDTLLRRAANVFGTPWCRSTSKLTLDAQQSRLAQMVERKTLNLVVVGSIPTAGGFLVSLVGQDTRLSPVRPGFKSRTRKRLHRWPRGLRRSTQVRVSLEAWVRIPLDAQTAWPSGSGV